MKDLPSSAGARVADSPSSVDRDDAIRCLAEAILAIASDLKAELSPRGRQVLLRIANSEELV